ncbi:MAG: hypothetical protein FJ410_03285 [Verrucomicrobia bacterium]|nr:hypothetical protein [Verrucomicrobiota bacterium]
MKGLSRSGRATLLATCLVLCASVTPPAAAQDGLVAQWQRLYETWRPLAPPTRLEDLQWSEKGSFLVYRTPQDKSAWTLVDTRSGSIRPAFDPVKLAESFSKSLGRQTSPSQLPFRTIIPMEDGRLFLRGEKKFWWLAMDGSLQETDGAGVRVPVTKLSGDGRSINAGVLGTRSPRGPQHVDFKDGDIYLLAGEGSPARKIFDRPSGSAAFVGPPAWSPDGRHFAVWREQKQPVRQYVVVDSAKGVTKEIPYDKPGDERTERQAWVFTADGKTASGCPSDLTGKTYSTGRLDWSADGKTLRTEYVRRGFTGHGIVAYDVTNGRWRKLITEEEPEKFIYTFKTRFRHDLSDSLTLWASEKSGWRHLYAVDLRDGRTLRPVTSGEWMVKQVLHVDENASAATFIGVGMNRGENPYHHHVCKVKLDGSGLVDLTPGDADHEAVFSPDRSVLVDVATRVDSPPVFTLRSGSDGRAIATLLATDTRRLEAAGWSHARPFVAKDRDGKFDIWGVVTRPHPFDPAKKYPVIENIYAGPHGSFAPKSMNWWNRNHRELSMLGFFVVQVDGRGTNNRGKEFHHQSWRNLKDGGFPDRIAWMRALARTEPNMDLSRVGIFGGSAGGQNTAHAMLLHGDFYKAGAADCGCYDNRVDKLWWNEQWLGWPIGPWYEENSCATHASRLKGRLFLTLGESDTNVDVKCTYDFHAALMAAGKTHLVELHVAPGAGHGAGESNVLREKRARFFISSLGRPTPL